MRITLHIDMTVFRRIDLNTASKSPDFTLVMTGTNYSN
jgi:hypothetical protein